MMKKKGSGIAFVRLTLVALMALAFVYSPAESATINVTANAPDVLNGANTSCALREAIQNINDGATTYVDCTPASGAYGASDLINLPTGTYTNAIGGTGENANATGDLDITKSVIINGTGATSTFINGGAIDRVFHLNPAAGGVVVNIAGVTIQNGNTTSSGGAIENRGTLTITNVTLDSNIATNVGAGIYNWAGQSLTVSNSIISNNTGSTNGGAGIYNNGGTVNITNSTITSNATGVGGSGAGIVNRNLGTTTITSSTISNNTASFSGGGIANYGATLNITDSTISNNTATITNGGGIDSSTGTMTVTKSTISGNTAGQDAGGIGVNAGVTLNLTNSTISGNTAARWGGGVSTGGTVNAINSTITANTANTAGGGFYKWLGALNLKNTIVANQAAGGDCNANVTSTLNDLDSDGTCGVGALSNQNPQLGALANNGGPTFTHALQSCSPAIGAGDPTTCANAPVGNVDQRGVARPQGAVCDIGAYEAAVSAPSATTDPASAIAQTGGTLNGTVNDNGADTTVTFDYGTTAGYGTNVAATQSPVTVGSCATPVSKAIAGLTCGTKYHYRVVGQNVAGTTNGLDANFTTTACAGGVQNFQLTVETSGSGAGTIYTAAHDIDCPHGCVATYPAGTQVTLYAWEGGGSSFSGWNGACAGTGRGDPCIVTMDQDRVAGGHFITLPTGANNAPDGGDGKWLFYPDDGGAITGTQTSILWKQLTDADSDPIGYTPEVCDNPDFANCNAVTVQQYTLAKAIGGAKLVGGIGAGAVGLFAFGFILVGAGRTKQGKALALTLLLVMAPLSGVLLASCGSSGGNTDTTTPTSETYANCSSVPDGYNCATVTGLTPGASYSWRVTADDGKGGAAQSVTWNFTPGNN